MNWFGRANQLGNPTLVTGLAEPAVALIGPNGAGTQSSFGRCPLLAKPTRRPRVQFAPRAALLGVE